MATNNRKPGTVNVYDRDSHGFRTNVLKSAWRKSGKLVSLKEFANSSADGEDTFIGVIASNWLHNKQVNTSHPPKGIGHTNGKKGKSNNGGQKASKREKD